MNTNSLWLFLEHRTGFFSKVSHLYYVVGGTHSPGACSFFGAAAFADGFTLYFLHGARCAAANPTSLLLADLV